MADTNATQEHGFDTESHARRMEVLRKQRMADQHDTYIPDEPDTPVFDPRRAKYQKGLGVSDSTKPALQGEKVKGLKKQIKDLEKRVGDLEDEVKALAELCVAPVYAAPPKPVANGASAPKSTPRKVALTPEQVEEVKKRHATGESYRSMCGDYGVVHTTLSDAVNGKGAYG